MTLFRSLDELPTDLRGGALSIGNFDGVHRGHARLIAELVAAASAVGGPALVLTFDPHPIALLRADPPPAPLSTPLEKYALLRSLGATAVVIEPTTRALLDLSARAFFDRVIVGRFGARALVEGENFAFGRERVGTPALLAEWCPAAEIDLRIVTFAESEAGAVSSSAVRQALHEGAVERAAELLGRPYAVTGTTVHGAKRGRTIGFPTANLEGTATLLPAGGIYAGTAEVDGRRTAAAIHLGPIPTFGDAERRFEVHLLDWSGDLYGRPLRVEFLRRLREIRTFGGVEELRGQLELDVAAARRVTIGD